jgi:hypothetical protein
VNEGAKSVAACSWSSTSCLLPFYDVQALLMGGWAGRRRLARTPAVLCRRPCHASLQKERRCGPFSPRFDGRKGLEVHTNNVCSTNVIPFAYLDQLGPQIAHFVPPCRNLAAGIVTSAIPSSNSTPAKLPIPSPSRRATAISSLFLPS